MKFLLVFKSTRKALSLKKLNSLIIVRFDNIEHERNFK